jgi:hypothetical protein
MDILMRQYSYLQLRGRRNVLLGTATPSPKASTGTASAGQPVCQLANPDACENAERPPLTSPQKTRTRAIFPLLTLAMPRLAG